jgi:hypothetical protein
MRRSRLKRALIKKIDKYHEEKSALSRQLSDASNVIARFWRKCINTKYVINRFHMLNLSDKFFTSPSHERLISICGDKLFLSKTRACLIRLIRLCIRKHGKPDNFLPEINVPIFLRMFIIVHKRKDAFRCTIGKMETELYYTAVSLMDSFQMVVNHLMMDRFATLDKKISSTFIKTLFEYYTKYKNLRTKEKIVKSDILMHSIVEQTLALRSICKDDLLYDAVCTKAKNGIAKARTELKCIQGDEALTKLDHDMNMLGLHVMLETLKEKIRNRSTIQRNVQILYEMLHDEDFKFSVGMKISPLCDNAIDMSSTDNELINQDFWSNVAQELNTTPLPCLNRSLKLMAVMRDLLLEINPHGNARTRVLAVFNIQSAIARKIEDKTTVDKKEWITFFSDAFGLVKSMCLTQEQKMENDAKLVDMTTAFNSATVPIAIRQSLQSFFYHVKLIYMETKYMKIKSMMLVIKTQWIQKFRNIYDEYLRDGRFTMTNTEVIFHHFQPPISYYLTKVVLYSHDTAIHLFCCEERCCPTYRW